MSIIICSFHALGHLIPSMVLARKLAMHGLKVIYVFPGRSLYNRVSKGKDLFPSHLNITCEVIDFEDGQSDVWPTVASGLRKVEVPFSNIGGFFARLPIIRSKLEELKSSTPISALIVDYVILWEGILTKDIGLPVYAYWPCSTASIVSFIHVVTKSPVDANGAVELPTSVPGLPTLYSYDFDPGLSSQSHPVYCTFKEWNKWFDSSCQGMILNTFEAFEAGPLATARYMFGKPVYAIGPLLEVRDEQITCEEDDDACIQWLDSCSQRSVLFVCFGSWLELCESQLHEIALGLEKSGKHFLWVMQENAREFTWLPDFEARTKEQGMVIKGWAPQHKILSHVSIGGFITTGGWNSVVESALLSGVPIVAWPLYLDHNITCRYLVDGLKIAVEVSDEDGFVNKDEVSRVVELVMSNGDQAQSLRQKAVRFKEAAAAALAKGGSTYMSLESLATELKLDTNHQL